MDLGFPWVDPLEVADEHHPKVDPRRNTWTFTLLIELPTGLLDEGIEAGVPENLIEFGVERMTRTLDDLGGRNEELDLLVMLRARVTDVAS